MPFVRGTVRREKRNPIHKGASRLNAVHYRYGEIPLAENPKLFAEIFGGCEYPNDAVRKLMAAVALTVIKDYFSRPTPAKTEREKLRIQAARKKARQYIFDDNAATMDYVFSFPAVCKSLGISTDYARRGISQRSPDEIRGIVQRLTCHRADYDGD